MYSSDGMGMSSSHVGSDWRNTSAVSNCPSWVNSSFMRSELMIDRIEGSIPSSEHIARDKIFHLIVVTNEPQKILLKYTISEPIAELIDQCIQSRFGGIGLPTTIKNSQRSVINQGNLVAVEIHSRHTAVSDNFSVSRFPTLVSVDCCVHLGFDLTHGVVWFGWLG